MKRIKARENSILILLLLTAYFGIMYAVMNYLDISCVFLALFGIHCPGCGMTRAFLSLIKLDFYNAARYNIVVFFMPYVFAYILFDFKHKSHKFMMIGIAAVAVVNWIIKFFI